MPSNEATSGEVAVTKIVDVVENTVTTVKMDTNGTTTTETVVTTNTVTPPAGAVTKPAPVKTVASKTSPPKGSLANDPTGKVAPPKVESANTGPTKSATTSSGQASAKGPPTKTVAIKGGPVTGGPSKASPNNGRPTKGNGTKPQTARVAPPGYKLIKVKDAQGKIIVVKTKLTDEELAAAAKKGQTVKPDNSASEKTKAVEYKIVSIPQSDGTLVKVRRPIHAEDITSNKPAETKKTEATNKDGKTVAVTEKEKTGPDDGDEPMDEATRKEMIRKQKHKYRMGRSRKYRRTLLRGFVMQLIGELPDIEIDHGGFHDGDQVISDDDSDLDFDSDRDDNDLFGDDHDHDDDDDDGGVHDGHDNDGHDNDHDAGHTGDSDHKFNIKTKKIAANIYDNVAAQTQKKKPAVTAANKAVPGISKEAPANGATGTNNPVATGAAAGAKPKASEKVTYTMNTKDLEQLDEEKPTSQLQRHWENISFYAMGSLSIILPLLFVLLAVATTIMNGKLVGSHWDAVANALKIAVSAWPIVFAAVVAQCFKTYATYKVERGIKLMQLEQLVGSSSFASALKQPIMLRRLDVYALVIFVAWCLSPIGGQAIVRVISSDWKQNCVDSKVWYLSRNGINPVMDSTGDYFSDGNDLGTHQQQAAMIFATVFNPYPGIGGTKSNFYQDSWGNPQTPVNLTYGTSSVFGVPFFLTDSLFFADAVPDYYAKSPLSTFTYDGGNEGNAASLRNESFKFPITTSYFAFDCGDWQTLTSAEMADKVINYNLLPVSTVSPTFYMGFGWTDEELSTGSFAQGHPRPDMLRWGSFNWLTSDPTKAPVEVIQVNTTESSNSAPLSNGTAEYSYIECPLRQDFLIFNVTCVITQMDFDDDSTYTCDVEYATKNITATTQNSTRFFDFTSYFVDAVKPSSYSTENTISPFERYLASNGQKLDTLFDFKAFNDSNPIVNPSYAHWYDMSNNTTPDSFAATFGFAFNSWMDAGYCPGACRTSYPTTLMGLAMEAGIPLETERVMANASSLLSTSLRIPESMFESSSSQWCYTANYIYVSHAPYLALLYICSIALLILGIASVIIESRVVAPDILGYASTVARNSRYLHLPATAPGMSGADRVRKFGGTVVMMQDVKKDADVGRIALGNKKEDSAKLRTDRTYR
ncbi:hypothetical protein SBRCBS47491_001387 [Sporothrix bragantina]|uniref:Uncharacterized protein n=1 Tax=Sporothrix bragantina TaxID=671064 RepID=A0ABP0AY68_9PEZI